MSVAHVARPMRPMYATLYSYPSKVSLINRENRNSNSGDWDEPKKGTIEKLGKCMMHCSKNSNGCSKYNGISNVECFNRISS
jgi:hypothetical protein